jgi:hypothetical protein
MALCGSQRLAASAGQSHAELGFPGQFIFFLPLALNHFHEFYLNQIQD